MIGNELLHGDGLREFPDGHGGTLQGDGRQHHVNAGAVLQAGIHNGGGGVDHPVDAAHDVLNQLLQLLRTVEAFPEARHFSVFFDEDFPARVDHDLCDMRIVQQLRQHVQATEAVENGLSEVELVPKGKLLAGQQEFVNAETELRIGKLLGFRQPRENFCFQFFF